MPDYHGVSLIEWDCDRRRTSCDIPLNRTSSSRHVMTMIVGSSPKTRRRRRREEELEARRLTNTADSSSDSSRESNDDAGGGAPRCRMRFKANSASPARSANMDDQLRERRRQRRSYRQQIRAKQERSRAVSADHKAIQLIDGSSWSQVHWKVHRMPSDTRDSCNLQMMAHPAANSPSRPSRSRDKRSAGKKISSHDALTNGSMASNGRISIPTIGTLIGRHDVCCSKTTNKMAILNRTINNSLTRNPSVDSHQKLHSNTLQLLSHADAFGNGNGQCSKPPIAHSTNRNSRESSPLDTIPVKETQEPSGHRVVLKWSDNSAFRPIRPASLSTLSEHAILHCALPSKRTVTQSFRTKTTTPREEPVHVSVEKLTKHMPESGKFDGTSEGEIRWPRRSISFENCDELKSRKVERFSTCVVKPGSTTVVVQCKPDTHSSSIDCSHTTFSKPFLTSPPKQDESNLERWKARKRTIETSKNEFISVTNNICTNKTCPPLKSYSNDVQNSESAAAKPRNSFREQIVPTESVEINHGTHDDLSLAQPHKKTWIVTPSRLKSSTSVEGAVSHTWKQRDQNACSSR